MSAPAVTNWIARPQATPGGRIRVPGDKSISHRAVMLGALADEVTEVRNFLAGADCLATAEAMRALGVRIESRDLDQPPAAQGGPQMIIHGVGLNGLRAAAGEIDLGNSGTSMRLLCGILAGQPFATRLRGDSSLNRRPMRRVTEPLGRMGARFDTTAQGTAPMTVHGARPLTALDYRLPVASAQVKSAVLLAGLFADGCTRVTEPAPTRDHTERMLEGFRYPLVREGDHVELCGGGHLHGCRIEVPGDISSAAFFFVAAAIVPEASITVENVGVNPTRTGVLTALERMGARVERLNEREVAGEPVADVRVTGAALRGIEIGGDLVPLCIDEIPVLCVAAACASGDTLVSGAAELRVKESDRVATTAAGLQALGIRAEGRADGIRVSGGRFAGGTVDSHGDHRIAMAFAVAAQVASGPVTIRDTANVATSFPGFLDTAAAAGLCVESSAA